MQKNKEAVTLQPRSFDRVDFAVRLIGRHSAHVYFDTDCGEYSLRQFRLWCVNYVLANHDAFLGEIGPVLTPITSEAVVAFDRNGSSRTYKRPSRLPELERTSPSRVELALTPEWIALGIDGLEHMNFPLELTGQLYGPYWTFLFKEDEGWVEYWKDGAGCNGKGGLWLSEEQYFPSNRYPWPLPLKFPDKYVEIGTLNNSLVPKPVSSFTQRIRSSFPWARRAARRHAHELGQERDRLAPKYEKPVGLTEAAKVLCGAWEVFFASGSKAKLLIYNVLNLLINMSAKTDLAEAFAIFTGELAEKTEVMVKEIDGVHDDTIRNFLTLALCLGDLNPEQRQTLATRLYEVFTRLWPEESKLDLLLRQMFALRRHDVSDMVARRFTGRTEEVTPGVLTVVGVTNEHRFMFEAQEADIPRNAKLISQQIRSFYEALGFTVTLKDDRLNIYQGNVLVKDVFFVFQGHAPHQPLVLSINNVGAD
jgi:hypothetical protein